MLFLAFLIIVASVALMVRRVEVRLVLLGAGLAMALLAGRPLAMADTFTRGMVGGDGGADLRGHGLRRGHDRHRVRPPPRAPPPRPGAPVPMAGGPPGGILAAYLVNMAVPSQTSTAAALGPILVPLLLASGYSAAVAGAALVLGASFGGDLLNPGAQDVQAIAGVVALSAPALSARIIPASIAGAVSAAVVFTLLNRPENGGNNAQPLVHAPEENGAPFRLDPLRALIPLVPIALLLLAYGGWPPLEWLVRPPEGEEWKPLANALPVVRAMLIGTLLAAIVAFRDIQRLTRSLFEGMGSGYGEDHLPHDHRPVLRGGDRRRSG